MPLWMKLMVRFVVGPLIAHTPDVPAATALKLLLADEWEGESAALLTLVGKFKRVPLSPNIQDLEEGRRLSALSEALVDSALGQAAPASPAAMHAT
jgi:hypothetical protein